MCSPATGASVIFGREAEREALDAFTRNVPTGPSAVVLEGEPGIGKSMLWNEGVDLARERGYAVLSCRPTGSDTELSLIGLGDLLRGLPEAAFADVPAPQREALEISLLRRRRGERRPDPRAVSVATLGVVQALAGETPIVVAIDDVQWLDGATARVLGFVVRRLSGAAVGFLLARTNVDEPPPLGVADALPPDRVLHLLVGPVGAETLAALVGERLGSTISLPEARQLAGVSGGNPFFALEIARAAARGDEGVTGQTLPIPKGLREDLVTQRVGSLPRASQNLLLVAAAVSRPTLDLLLAASTGSRPEAPLQAAIDSGIVNVTGRDVRFAHPIYRSAIYAHASRVRRHDVHRRLAAISTDPEERARHLALSAEGADEEIAAALEDSAASARDRGAPDAAAELLEHAIRLTPADPSAVSRRHLQAAEHRFVAGDTDGALTHAREALRHSAGGVGRARALRFLASVDLERGMIAEARQALDEAASEAQGDDRASSEVERDLAGIEMRSGELGLGERYARSALERAERSGFASFVPSVRVTLARIALLRGETMDDLGAVPDPGASVGPADPRSLGIELVTAEAEAIAGEHERARSRLEAVRRIALEQGDEPTRRAALVRLADVSIRDGSWQRAASLAEESRTLAGHLGVGDGHESGLLAYAAAARGMVEEARDHADRGLDRSQDDRIALLWNLGALGHLELSLGRPELALQTLGRAGGIATTMGLGEPAALPFLPDEAEALIGVGELDAGARRIEWFERRGTDLGRTSALAAAGRCRGRLLAETGMLSDALVALERSIAMYETLPLPFDLARTLLVLGTVRRRDRQKRPAREALDRALGLFQEFEAPIWAEQARDELSRVSGRRASFTELTEAEDRVVRLAASGLTNREISRALFMSVRTVEGHLSHAYAKLGLRSRTELAVFLQRSD
jgi:DNA-binding CsgD family transcriptional regulator